MIYKKKTHGAQKTIYNVLASNQALLPLDGHCPGSYAVCRIRQIGSRSITKKAAPKTITSNNTSNTILQQTTKQEEQRGANTTV